ncbi:MAG: D-alanine--D-alanine ligase [Actinomycetota bacterium]|nr:D-alanine--D-alanine ligase [Actinomycetota bacterium]
MTVIAVLMGGWGPERDVSFETGKAIASALRSSGHDVKEIDAANDLPLALKEAKPDVAFLALHGKGGEDGCVQGLLEVMRIPYTGSGVLPSAIAMNKVLTKKILSHHGITVAKGKAVSRNADLDQAKREITDELSFPLMVKPSCGGSSVAASVVHEADSLPSALERVFACDSEAVVELFIPGRLMTVGILGKEPIVLPVLEIKTKCDFYDYRAKYEKGMTDYEVPAHIDEKTESRLKDIALKVFEILGCEGIARVDMMLADESGEIYTLEINTIPGMTSTSLIPKAAGAIGMSFEEVVEAILNGARLKAEFGGQCEKAQEAS